MISDKIKKLRDSHNITQLELAEALGVTMSAVSAWENNVSEPRMGMVQKIADYFKVKVSYLVNDDEPEPYDPDVQGILDLLDRRTDYKILFSKTSHLKNGQLDKIAKILEASLPEDEE